MKILRMTGMALVVILMSVHFVACNDDNDDDDNGVIYLKKIKL